MAAMTIFPRSAPVGSTGRTGPRWVPLPPSCPYGAASRHVAVLRERGQPAARATFGGLAPLPVGLAPRSVGLAPPIRTGVRR